VSEVSAAHGALTLTEGADARRVAIGFGPSAVILWWTRQPEDGLSEANSGGIGFAAAGTAETAGAPATAAAAWAVGWISEPGRSVSRASSCACAAPLVGLSAAGAPSPGLMARLEVEDGGFIVRPELCRGAWRVHFLAVGGADVAAEAGWTSAPEGSPSQRLPLARRPGLLLLAGIGGPSEMFATTGDTGAAAAAAAAGLMVRGISLSLGACSSARRQAGVALAVPDGHPPGTVAGAQRADAALVTVAAPARISGLARVSRVDPTGFDLSWADAAHPPLQVIYLALSGVRSRVGAAQSRPPRARMRIRAPGVAPKAVLAFSWGLGKSSAPSRIGRLSLGAAAGSETGASGWDERNRDATVTVGHVHSDRTAVLLVPDSQTGGLHATARCERFHRDGFTLHWPLSDAVSRELVYVTLGVWAPGPARSPFTALMARLGAQRQHSASSTGR
jgi:hypothetical protein